MCYIYLINKKGGTIWPTIPTNPTVPTPGPPDEPPGGETPDPSSYIK